MRKHRRCHVPSPSVNAGGRVREVLLTPTPSGIASEGSNGRAYRIGRRGITDRYGSMELETPPLNYEIGLDKGL